MADNLTLEVLIQLIKEVQPSLEATEITGEQSVVDDLGLDSLDLLQLSRRISRDHDLDLDLDAWAEKSSEHNRSVNSIVQFLGTSVDA